MNNNAATPQNNRDYVLSLLSTTPTGEIKKNPVNYTKIILNDDELKDVFWEDWMNRVAVKPGGKVPWRREEDNLYFSEIDRTALFNFIAAKYDFYAPGIFDAALADLKNTRYFDRVKLFLEEEKWDGVKRADTVLVDYLGAEDTEYTRQATRKTLEALAVRQYKHGYKFDQITVLKGPQGIGKTTFWLKLFLPDLVIPFNLNYLASEKSREGISKTRSGCILDIAELAGKTKVDQNEIKDFISRQHDSFRDYYSKQETIIKRRFILTASTNDGDFLTDYTGNRRFWIIPVSGKGRLNIFKDLDEKTAKQIWAEVVEGLKEQNLEPKLYLEGDVLKEAIRIQTEELETHLDENLVDSYLSLPKPVDWDTYTPDAKTQFLDKYLNCKVNDDLGRYISGEVEELPAGFELVKKVSLRRIFDELYRDKKETPKKKEIEGILVKLGYSMTKKQGVDGRYKRLPIFEPAN